MSSADNELCCRLRQLQSRFTWDLKEEDLELDDLSRQLDHDISQQLGQRGALANSYSFLAYVRYLQGKPEEALSLLQTSELETRRCYGEDNDLRLIVLYGDLAWLKYHTGDHVGCQTYCQRVEDILAKHPTSSPTVLHPEVYGEKAWTFLKFSKSYYPKATEYFREALKLRPDDCELNNGYAIVLYRTEEVPSASQSQCVSEPDSDESPATTQLRKAVALNPSDGVLLSMLALKLWYCNKDSEADDLVKRALRVGADDTQVTRYVGKYLRKQNRLDESISLLKQMLEENNQSAFIHHQLALCYNGKINKVHQNRNPSEREKREVENLRHLIIRHLEKAIELKSTLNHAKALLALQYAEEHKKTTCPCSPNHCCRELQRVQDMFDDVLKKLEEEPQSIRHFICRCYAEFCQYHTIQKDLAVTYYLKALDFSTSSSEKNYCAKKLKQIAERRIDRNHRDAAAYGILGAVARAEGYHRRAVRYYEKALEQDGDNNEYLSALFELRLDLENQSDRV